MKNLIFLLLVTFCMSCENDEVIGETPLAAMIEAEDPANFTCIYNEFEASPPSLEQAQDWLVGKWQMKAVIVFLQDPQIPNYQLEFKEDGSVEVSLAGKAVYSNASYSLVENDRDGTRVINILTDDATSTNEHHIIKGMVRICENELMLDQGTALDAPGYLFRRVED